MKKYQPYQLTFILTPFVFSFAFGLDIYIPLIPQMAQIFSTTQPMVHLTLSLFLLTTGVGQLFIGPFSDQYGRKKIFILSSLLFALGSLACAFSPSILALILARILSSFGACGMLTTSFALIRDLFSKDENAKMYSYLNGAIGISPTFAPIIGGYLALYFGWQSVFYFLTGIGILALFITGFFIKETCENRIKMDARIFKRYGVIFSNRQFMNYSLIAGLAESVFFCFFSVSPFIIIELLSVPSHEFGYYFALFGVTIGLGGLGGGKLIEKIGVHSTIYTGIAFIFVGGFSMLIWHYFASLSLSGFLGPMIAACFGAILLVGCCASQALEPFGEMAGTASAAFGSMEFGISAFAGAIMMLFPMTSTVPYAITILLVGVFSLAIFLTGSQVNGLSKESHH